MGRDLQAAIQDLVAAVSGLDPYGSLRLSMQLYQAVLMAVLMIPELQPRAQDLLLQSRLWLLSEQIRRIEHFTQQHAEGTVSLEKANQRTNRKLLSAEPDAAKLRVGDIVASGRVELLALMVRGGLGESWKGRVIATGEFVAVKFLAHHLNEIPEVVSKFSRELKFIYLARGFQSPVENRTFFEKGRYFYVAGYINDPVNLKQAFSYGGLPVDSKLQLLSDVAQAVHELHERGLIHGDIKPENIVREGNSGPIRIVDFGSARRIGAVDETDPITFTHAYAAPELYSNPLKDGRMDETRGRGRITHALPPLDVYALGIMLVQALDPGLWNTAQMGHPDIATRLVVSTTVRAVVKKALAIDPSDRFQSALEFKLALEEAVRAST